MYYYKLLNGTCKVSTYSILDLYYLEFVNLSNLVNIDDCLVGHGLPSRIQFTSKYTHLRWES